MDKVIKDGTEMTIGVDLGDKWIRLCVLDEHGEVCEEGRIATTADAMRKRFSTEAPCRIVIEVGTHSPWVQRLAAGAGARGHHGPHAVRAADLWRDKQG